MLRPIPGSATIYRRLRRAANALRVTLEYRRYARLAREQGAPLLPRWRERALFLDNRSAQTPFDRHYVYHTAWAIRQLVRLSPREHVDVSSSLYFVALASAMVPIRHIDYRPPALFLDRLECSAGDLMDLPFADNSVPSLSCMHVVEHVGLGRYGDPIDPLADTKSCQELIRVLAPGGTLLFVVPVGRARVCFNGHRIYSFELVRDLFKALNLVEWALIPDDAMQGLTTGASPEHMNVQEYGCGCFVFQKPTSP